MALLITIAFWFPYPSSFQYVVFRIVLALAAAGVAAFIPGFLSVILSGWLRAGGAMAVFVIVYFFSPASLISKPQVVLPAPVQQIGNISQSTDSGSNTGGVQGNVTNQNQGQQSVPTQPKQKTK